MRGAGDYPPTRGGRGGRAGPGPEMFTWSSCSVHVQFTTRALTPNTLVFTRVQFSSVHVQFSLKKGEHPTLDSAAATGCERQQTSCLSFARNVCASGRGHESGECTAVGAIARDLLIARGRSCVRLGSLWCAGPRVHGIFSHARARRRRGNLVGGVRALRGGRL